MIYKVSISEKVLRKLKKIPSHVLKNLTDWVVDIENLGLEVTRRVPGYHDEPLKGQWEGYRSVRLNKAYRAIYRIDDKNEVRLVTVIEVNKHVY